MRSLEGLEGPKYDESHYSLGQCAVCVLYEGREERGQCKCEEVKTLGLSCLTTDHLDNVKAVGGRRGGEGGGGGGWLHVNCE